MNKDFVRGQRISAQFCSKCVSGRFSENFNYSEQLWRGYLDSLNRIDIITTGSREITRRSSAISALFYICYFDRYLGRVDMKDLYSERPKPT